MIDAKISVQKKRKVMHLVSLIGPNQALFYGLKAVSVGYIMLLSLSDLNQPLFYSGIGLSRGSHQKIRRCIQFHLKTSKFTIKLALIGIGKSDPLPLLIDRRFGIPLGQLITICSASQSGETERYA